MKLYLKKVKESVQKRIENGPIKGTSYIPAIMKTRRLELKMTLHDETKGICSEALLSKIERNLVDVKNEKVHLLCERLNLDYYTLINLEATDRIEKMLYMYFDEEYDDILQIEDKICDGVYIAQDELIKAYKYLILKDYKALYNCILGLDTVKECLSDLEFFALLLIVFEYNFTSCQFGRAEEYIKLLEKLNINDKKCNLFVKERLFALSCKRDTNLASYLFAELRKEPYYSISKQFLFSIYFIQTLDQENSYEHLLQMGKDYIPKRHEEEYMYTKALILTKLGRYLEAMDVIYNYNSPSVRFASLYSYNLCMYSMNKVTKEEIREFRTKLLDLMKNCVQTTTDTYHVAFIRLMQYEIDKTEEEIICNYIKNSLLKELNEFSHPLYDSYIYNRYSLLLGKLGRYKDSYTFLLEHKNYLKK